MMEPIAGIR